MISIILLNVSVILVIYFISKFINLRQKPYNFTNPKKSALFSIAIVAIDIYLLNPIILLFLIKYFPDVTGPLKVLLECIFPIIEVAPVALALWLRKEPVNTLGLTSLNLAKSIIIGIICSIIFTGGIIIINLSSISFGLNKLWTLMELAIVGLTEEIIFRGYAQTRLIAWLGKPKGLVISSLLFSIAHFPQRMLVYGYGVIAAAKSSLLLMPTALVLGYMMMKTENITAPAILHTFVDWSQNLLGKS